VEDLSLCAEDNVTSCFQSINNRDVINNEIAEWCVNSDCNSHMCGECKKFTIVDNSVNGEIRLTNQSSTYIKGKGLTILFAFTNGQEKRVNLNNILFVFELRTNLLSVGKMCDKGYRIIFNSKTADVTNKNGRIVLRAERHNSGLYFLKTAPYKSANTVLQSNESSTATEIWHKKMSFLNYRNLAKRIGAELAKGIDMRILDKITLCEVYTHGKMTRTPFLKKSSRSTDTLDIIRISAILCEQNQSENLNILLHLQMTLRDGARFAS